MGEKRVNKLLVIELALFYVAFCDYIYIFLHFSVNERGNIDGNYFVN